MEPFKICEHCKRSFARPKRISDARWNARKFCTGSCRSLARYGDTDDRFWKNVAVSRRTSCWLWLAAKDTAGYGAFREGETIQKAHRYSFSWCYELTLDDLKTKQIAHHCTNNSCCNPFHLFINDGQPRLVSKLPKKRRSI